MYHSMLNETISLLKEMQFQQSNTGGCVIKSLNRVIRNLETLKSERLSEPEMGTLILDELGSLFSEFPELQQELIDLTGL